MNTRSFISPRPQWLVSLVSAQGTRLMADDAEDLRYLWHSFEADIGYSGIDYERAMKSGGGDVFYSEASDPYEDDAILGAVKRARRVRRALQRVSPFYAVVLYRVYGPVRHHAPYGQFGDLAQIIEYTESAARLAEKAHPVDCIACRVADRAGRLRCLSEYVRDAIERRLRQPHAKEFVSSMKTAGEKLLWKASDAYREAKACSLRS